MFHGRKCSFLKKFLFLKLFFPFFSPFFFLFFFLKTVNLEVGLVFISMIYGTFFCILISNPLHFSSGYLMMQNCYKVRGFLNNDLFFQNQMIKELESRVQQLTGEAENSNLQKQKLIQEKLELERCYQITCNELQEVKARYCLRSDNSQVWL